MRPVTILKVVAGVFGVVVIAAAGVLLTLDVNRYKGTIQEEVERLTGRKLLLEGDLSLSLSLNPAIVVNKARFANASWGSQPDMVSVERVEAQIELIPALSGDIRLSKVILVKPEILLETDRKGTGNWEMSIGQATADPAGKGQPNAGSQSSYAGQATPAPSASGASGGAAIPFLGAVSIEQARITLKDAASGTSTVFDLESLTLSADSATSPLMLAVKGAYNSIPYAVEGTFGPLQALVGGSETPYPVDLKGDFGGIDLAAAGSIKDPKAVQGVSLKVSVKADSYAGLKGMVPSEGVPPVTLTGTVTGGGNSWTVSGLEALVAKTALAGTVTARTGGARPKIDVALTSPQIDLREWVGKSEPIPASSSKSSSSSASPAAPAGKSARVLPSDPLDLGALYSADAKADIKIAKLILPNSMELDAVAVQAALDNGRLRLTPAQAAVGDGTVAATVDLTAAPAGKPGLSAMTADVRLTKVVLGRLFEQMGQPDLLSAVPTNGVVSVKAQGTSVAALLASLDGTVNVSMGTGKIHNALLDWVGGDILDQVGEALNPASQRQPYTELSCGEIHMKATKGQMAWDKQIAFETSRMNVVSSGGVNFGTEGLNIGVQPYTKTGTGLSAGKLAEMLRLQGTMAQPRLGIDAQAAAQAVASVGAAVATGGMSTVLGALLGGNSTDTNPCATARGEKPAPTNSSSQGGSEPAKQAPLDPGSVVKGLGGLFK